MEKSDLQKTIIKVTSINLKTITNKDGSEWKKFEVVATGQERGIYYSFSPFKADKTKSKAYLIYIENKSAWENSFLMGDSVELEIVYKEKRVDWEKNGKKGTSRYRNIVLFNQVKDEGNQVTKDVDTEDMSIPF